MNGIQRLRMGADQKLRPIFISYPRSLEREAWIVFQTLRANGFSIWMDRINLQGGEPVSQTICKAIREVCAVIIIVARDTANSKYVLFEWSCAQGASVPAIPMVWGDPVDLPAPWDRIASVCCPEAGSNLIANQICTALLSVTQPTFEQPHHLTLVCGTDKDSRLIAQLAAGDAELMGLKVWSFPASLTPGLESVPQLKRAISNSHLVTLIASEPDSPILWHAAGITRGEGKPIVIINTQPGTCAPWSFLGDINCLNFSGDLYAGRFAFQRTLQSYFSSGTHVAPPPPSDDPSAGWFLKTGS